MGWSVVAVQPKKPTNANVSDVFLISPFQLSLPQPPSFFRHSVSPTYWQGPDRPMGLAMWSKAPRSFADSTAFRKWPDRGVISHGHDGGEVLSPLISVRATGLAGGFGETGRAVLGLVGLWWANADDHRWAGTFTDESEEGQKERLRASGRQQGEAGRQRLYHAATLSRAGGSDAVNGNPADSILYSQTCASGFLIWDTISS